MREPDLCSHPCPADTRASVLQSGRHPSKVGLWNQRLPLSEDPSNSTHIVI